MDMEAKLGAALVIVVCMVALFAPHAELAISCDELRFRLLPCLGFLQGGALSSQCCDAVRSAAAATSTPYDRRAACNCLKEAAASHRNMDFGHIASLPGKCGVRIPFQIRPNIDCSRVG